MGIRHCAICGNTISVIFDTLIARTDLDRFWCENCMPGHEVKRKETKTKRVRKLEKFGS
jgi:hypothetical protein